MASKNTRKILISLIIGVVAACVSLNKFSEMQKEIKEKEQLIEVMQLRDKQLEKTKYTYLTATHDMEAGETVTEDDITTATFSTEESDGLTSKETVVGNVLLEPIKSGQILTGYVFTGIVSNPSKNNQGLKEGYRALTLSTSTMEGMSADMKKGSLIDVFSKNKSNSTVLSKVRILNLEAKETETEQKDISILQAKNVTFEVPVNKIQEFVEMYAAGKILLVMRPVGDDTVIVGHKKQSASTTNNNGYQNLNYNYNASTLPALPVVQTYEDSTINELPAPVRPTKSSKTVELIEASNKTQISFD